MTINAGKTNLYTLSRRMGLKCEILFADRGIICARFVSENFRDFPIGQRHTLLTRALNVHGKQLMAEFDVLFEVYTPEELSVLEPWRQVG